MKNKDVVVDIEKSLIHVELPKTWYNIHKDFIIKYGFINYPSFNFIEYLEKNYQIPQKL